MSSAPQTEDPVVDRWRFEPDGSRTWYAPAWNNRTTFHEADKVFVPIELLEAALGFLRRARDWTPLAHYSQPSLTDEIDKFLETFK